MVRADLRPIATNHSRLSGSAMTLGLMRLAAARGYRVATLLSTPAGLPLYQRLGFRKICDIRMLAIAS